MNIQDLKSTISNSAFKKSYSVSNISFKNFFTSIELYTNTDGNDLDSIFKAVPRFQRENDKWSESMQIKFIENVLKGLRSEILLFKVGDNILDSYMILDGLQRTTAIHAFISGKIKAFGHTFKELCEAKIITFTSQDVVIKLYDFDTENEAIEFYIDMNENITHQPKDIEKARKFLK